MTPQPAQLQLLIFMVMEDAVQDFVVVLMEDCIQNTSCTSLPVAYHEFLHLEVSDGNSRHDSDPGDICFCAGC